MTNVNAYRSILRSSAIIGASQVVSLLGALIRMKVVAILAGPVGVGLVGLYTSLIQVAAIAAVLGMDSAGARQIATAHTANHQLTIDRTRRTLFWGILGMSLISMSFFFLLADWIALVVFDDATQAATLRWLSLGVAVTVACGYQTALLTGLFRIGDIARISIWSSLIGSIIACAALWIWQGGGIIAVVIVPPAIMLLLGFFITNRIPPSARTQFTLRELVAEWKGLAGLGFALTLTGLVTLLGHLVARILVQHGLGPSALGHFLAAWTLSATCLGLVIGAMGTDYFPRLSAAMSDPRAAVVIINQQTEVGLLLCSPLFLILLGFAPWIVQLVYSAEFAPAVGILRTQILGDVLKVLSWPLGIAIMARGAGSTFFMTEAFGITLLVALIGIGIPLIGLEATGVSFLITNIIYLPLVWWFGGSSIGFRWSRSVKIHAVALITIAFALDLISRSSIYYGAIAGTIGAIIFGVAAVWRLSHRIGAGDLIERPGRR